MTDAPVAPVPLGNGPAKILSSRTDDVEFLPAVAAYISDEENARIARLRSVLSGVGLQNETEGIAQPPHPGPRLRRAGSICLVVGIAGQPVAGSRVDAEQLAGVTQQRLTPVQSDVLRFAQKSVGECLRYVAFVLGTARVGAFVRAAITRRNDQRTIRPEQQRTDPVALMDQRKTGIEGFSDQDLPAAGNQCAETRCGIGRVARHPPDAGLIGVRGVGMVVRRAVVQQVMPIGGVEQV